MAHACVLNCCGLLAVAQTSQEDERAKRREGQKSPEPISTKAAAYNMTS